MASAERPQENSEINNGSDTASSVIAGGILKELKLSEISAFVESDDVASLCCGWDDEGKTKKMRGNL